MKKIGLKNYSKPDKSSVYTEKRRYSIFLGNGLTLTFTTNKDLSFAMAEINRRLNLILFDLNEMFIECFSEYRRLWFYLPPHTLMSEESKIIELNEMLQTRFRIVTERSGWTNGNAFSFKELYLIIDYLLEELNLFVKLRKAKKQYLECGILESKKRMIADARVRLDNIAILPKYSPKKNPRTVIKKNSFRRNDQPDFSSNQ